MLSIATARASRSLSALLFLAARLDYAYDYTNTITDYGVDNDFDYAYEQGFLII